MNLSERNNFTFFDRSEFLIVIQPTVFKLCNLELEKLLETSINLSSCYLDSKLISIQLIKLIQTYLHTPEQCKLVKRLHGFTFTLSLGS